jgi:hypothetical protein
MTRLIQIQNGSSRAVAVVEEPRLRVLDGVKSVLQLALEALESGAGLLRLIEKKSTRETLDYEPIYSGNSPWKLLPPIDHEEPARCLVSGTGLTHLGSAKNRNAMHNAKETDVTDSMKMFRWGLEGGKPAAGKAGVAPEWFFKGVGTILRAHNEALPVPYYAEDGGEEAEVAGAYVIDPAGKPRRIGMATGNEFSDHKFEKRNYLYLAGSKIRPCSLGPELVVDPAFQSVSGKAAILRGGKELWSKDIATGEAEMSHSLANMEHHHFKFESHCRPGDVHVHFFGACALSFGEGVELADGDIMEVRWENFGRALRNPLKVAPKSDAAVAVTSMA